jgi:DNA replication protein DnaD
MLFLQIIAMKQRQDDVNLTFYMYLFLGRGFRQATRGPDTGAFHHPLFRRDKPELCVEMVCQRSRSNIKVDRETTGGLLVKKRRVSTLTKESLEAMNQEQVTDFSATPSLTTAEVKTVTVSEDSRSLRSSISRGSPPVSESETTPTIFQKQSPLPVMLLGGGCVTNNAKLIQSAIAKRNEEERMRVAKVMLYNSFLQAMNGEDLS